MVPSPPAATTIPEHACARRTASAASDTSCSGFSTAKIVNTRPAFVSAADSVWRTIPLSLRPEPALRTMKSGALGSKGRDGSPFVSVAFSLHIRLRSISGNEHVACKSQQNEWGNNVPSTWAWPDSAPLLLQKGANLLDPQRSVRHHLPLRVQQ